MPTVSVRSEPGSMPPMRYIPTCEAIRAVRSPSDGGGIACKSTKQKLNTRSSTEAEFVGASDYLPNTIWTKNFLGAQGYKILDNVLEQDNESAMKLEKNGRLSAGPKSRHIDIRYFWIKDRLICENIKVRHCPTLQMIADFFTKPLQGSLFHRLRDVVMGITHTDSLALPPVPPPLEERVGRTMRPGDTTVGPSPRTGTGASNTVTEKPCTNSQKSWADVVRTEKIPEKQKAYSATKQSRFREVILSKQSNSNKN